MSYPRNDFEARGFLKPGHYNLQIGAPGPAYLKEVANYLETAFANLKKNGNRFEETLQYGVWAGGIPVREEVAKFLSRQYNEPVDKDDLYITSGATSALVTMLGEFFTSNHIVFMENPTYPTFASKVNVDKLVKGVPVPLESDGLNLDALEEKLKNLPDIELTPGRPFRAGVYVITTHHNPTGCCYSPEKCRRLVALARKYDLLVICDDVYNILNYQLDPNNPSKFLPPPKRLFAYDNKNDADYKGNVVSNGTFSKIVAPGLRMGWYEAPARVFNLMKSTYLCTSGSGQTAYLSYAVAEALKSGSLDLHVDKLRKAHKARFVTMISVIEDKLSKYGVTCTHPEGGYFLWVAMPEGVDSRRVLELSKEKNVTFITGNLASVVGEFSNYLRLSIAYYEVDDIREGVERLCGVIETAILEKQ